MKKKQGQLSSDVLQLKEMLTYYWGLRAGKSPTPQGTTSKAKEAQGVFGCRPLGVPLH